MEKVIFHIDMDAYFTSIEQLTNPFLKGKPVAVSGGPSTKSVIASCSYIAKNYGIKSGMSTYQALSLCPQLIIVSGNPEKYIETSKKIFEIIRSFKEEIEIYSIDEVFIDVTDIYEIYGKKENLAREIKDRIKKITGLTCSVGGGPNRLIAKIASSLSKPDGIKIIEAEYVESFMNNLPIEEIPGIGERIYKKLSDIGIEKCSDVKKVGQDFLTKIFGKLGMKIYNYGCGIEIPPLYIEYPEISIGHSYTFPSETDNFEIIEKTLFNLCEKVAERMRKKKKYGNFVLLFLRFEDFSSIVKRKKFNNIPPDGKIIFNLCIEIINSIIIDKKIRTIGISVGGLFYSSYPYIFNELIKRELLLDTMDRINEKFGENTIFPAILLNKQINRKTHSFYFWLFKNQKNKNFDIKKTSL
ncbi:MAG: DNA polymerase IV [bacterium]|nr:DNA polymerase IV [bacterium]MCX7916787.1 DNA polymerase IV [bacterium]MDW8163858.1 DNA polymerase IV [Candidatus Omnitrophota bacterium]